MSKTPARLTWYDVKTLLPLDTEVTGHVIAVQLFGVFLDLAVGFSGLLEVPDMTGNTRMQERDYPVVVQKVTPKVIQHLDHDQKIQLCQRS